MTPEGEDIKVLIAPLAALAETKDPIPRARTLAATGQARGRQVAFCAALGGAEKIYAVIESHYPVASGQAV